MIYLELFFTFFVIGIFTIGGGYAMLSLIQAQVVSVHEWIDAQTFTDIVAISQMTPGPIGINSATYIGYSILEQSGASQPMCILGSFTATFAVVLPSFIITLAICRAYTKFKDNDIFLGIMSGLKPVVVGLIGAAAIILMTKENFPDWKSYVLAGVTIVISMVWKKLSPIWIILGGGLAGYLIY